jgi:hypothetical protein
MTLKTKSVGGALALNGNGKLTCECCDPCVEFNSNPTIDVVVSGWPGESCCNVLGLGTEEAPYYSYKTVGELNGSYTLEYFEGFGFVFTYPDFFTDLIHEDENCESLLYSDVFAGSIGVVCIAGEVTVSVVPGGQVTLPLATFLSSGVTIPYSGCPDISITVTVA